MLGNAAERDLVAEQLGVLSGARGAAKHPQQRQVEKVTKFRLFHPDPPAQLQADQATANAMLHRRAQTQIGRHREHGHDLGKPEPWRP
jgi:hypothetical protein